MGRAVHPLPGRRRRLYSAVFDWAVEEVRAGQETFITCSIDGKPVAGMMQMSATWEDTPSHWMPCFAVNDVDEAATLADGLGGQTVAAPHDTSAGAGSPCCVTRSERC